MPLPIGKLSTSFLEKLLKKVEPVGDLRGKGVILGSAIGEDAAIIDAGNPDTYLVAKTDPITFATSEIGYYVVNVNANDIATRGAVPRWFLSTVLLPEGKSEPAMVEEIFTKIGTACSEIGAVVVGGHTEVTHGLDRPVVIGSMLGEVPRDGMVTTSGARVGDSVVLTKGIVIEGVSVIAHEKERELLEVGFSADKIERAKNFLHDPGLSVVKEALIAAGEFQVHSMHDPTEGGLAMSLVEVAKAAGVGLEVDLDEVRVLPEARELCDLFGLDPYRTLTSGTLLLTMAPEDTGAFIQRLRGEGVFAQTIGEVVEPARGVTAKRRGKEGPLEFSEIDEITKIFA
ncbi:MAG: AIR synthase family protein [Promethearchaeota archaeon]